MSRKVAAGIDPGMREVGILRKIVCPKTLGSMCQERARIVLAAARGLTNRQTVLEENLEAHRIARWRNRRKKQHDITKRYGLFKRTPV